MDHIHNPEVWTIFIQTKLQEKEKEKEKKKKKKKKKP
jgi:hypothetical protein